MPQELPPVTVTTPTEAAVVTTVVRKSRWGRVYDVILIVAAFVLALLQSMGDINWIALGFTPTQAAWGAMVLFMIRFALAYRPVRVVETKVEPTVPPPGQP